MALEEELAAALPGDPLVTVTVPVEGQQRVAVEWASGGKFKFDFYPEATKAHVVEGVPVESGCVDWKDLTAAEPMNGLYDALCKVLPTFLKERGATHFLAYPRSLESREVLLRRLNWYDDPARPGYLRNDL